ncbi:hypothetical protein AYO49_03615 [Verrucomicrobiaceae bacterium SCGC AG-212-N21]|nr:hypothetical protein AYO49_03615 [Verrucomicrobiaceae bacterium SCGC AG-212-N21]
MNETDESPATAFRQRLIAQLSPMASLAYQRRYIVHGDAHSYALADELLDTLHHTLAQFRAQPEFHALFSLPQFAALDQLRVLLDEFSTDIDSIPNDELVERHAGWRAIREQSAICLALLGFDLDSWQANELNDNTRNA